MTLLLAQVDEQPAGFAELIEVETLLYRGVWIETFEAGDPSVRQALVDAAVDAAVAAGLDEIGAMVPEDKWLLRDALLARGFRSLGDFRWHLARLPLPGIAGSRMPDLPSRSMATPKPRSLFRLWPWLLAALILAALVSCSGHLVAAAQRLLPDQEQILAWVEGLGAWGPIAIILLEMIQALLAPIPGQAIEAASGYLYGPWWGTLFPMIGMVIGSSIIFLLARRFGRPLVIRLVGKKSMARLDDLVRRGGAPSSS